MAVKLSDFFKTLSFLMLVALLLVSCAEEKLTMEGTGTIQGKVLDELDLSPIVNAEVTTNPPSQSVLTDSTGQFVLEDVQVGEYNVIAKQKDFFSATTNIKVNLNTTSHVIINLTKRSEEENLPEFTDQFYPAHEQEDVPVNLTFSWNIKNTTDTVNFEVKLYEAGRLVPVHMEQPTDTFAVASGLKFSTDYLWQLTAENEAGTVYTDIRTFSTRTFPDEFLLFAKRADEVSQIFIADTVEESAIQITHNNFHSWRPLANPGKDKIAFLSTRDINPQLFVMDSDGSHMVKLTNIATGGYYNKGVGFSWLPDGERLVFSSYNKLYVINRDGTGMQELTSIDPDRHFREVNWSPVNDKIVTLTLGVDRYDAEILLMDTDGSNKEVIVGGREGAVENPVFSIDGKKILYTYDVSEFQSETGRQLDARIFEYTLETGNTRDMSAHKPDGTNDLMPRYTDNGARITFVNTQNTEGSTRDLWIMRADSTQSQHRNILIEDIEAPDW